MRIAPAERPPRHRIDLVDRDPRHRRDARLEGLALLAVSIVVVTGFWITYRRQADALTAVVHDLVSGVVVRTDAASTSGLAAKLTMFPSPGERRFAAEAIQRFVHDHGPLTHVGALAAITVPASEVRANSRLSVLRERLSQQPGAITLHLLTMADIAALKPALIVRTPRQYSVDMRTALAIFLAAFWMAHIVRRSLGTTGDAVLLPAMQLLSGLSLLALVSLRDPLRDSETAGGMAIGIALACATLTCVSSIDFENPRFRFAAAVPFLLAVVLGVLLLMFGSGPGVSGVKVNLWGVQPIEAIRVLAVLALAASFSRRWETVRELSGTPGSAVHVRLPRWQDVSPIVVIVGTLLAFFFLQKDLGPALVLGCLSLALYGVARGRSPLVLVGCAVLIAGFAAGYALGIPATVARRVAIWLDPWDNGLRGGDQIAHGLWALASGGVRGLGLARGDGQVVPAGHTDLILAVMGEELGLIGVLAIAALYLVITWRALQIAARAPGDYTAFLACGCALSLAVPAMVIVGGVVGVFPLSGVVTPFLSFGKSSMIGNFAAIGIVLAIARRTGPVRPQLQRQIRTVGTVLAVALLFLVADAARIQAWQADALAVRPTLVQQADGVARYQYNPRLLDAAKLIPRGTIFDRNGLVLATSEPDMAAPMMERLAKAGVVVPPCPAPPERCYPLRGRTFHLLGDWNEQTNWNAPNASFLERDQNPTLQGFDDHAHTIQRHGDSGRSETVVVRDYQELLPFVRHRGELDHPDVRRVLGRSRDVTTSIDGVFQALVTNALEARVRAAGIDRGAIVVIDPDSGELLAAASVPYPSLDTGGTFVAPRALLDRARYGLYPPGSTFKLITAAAALRAQAQSSEFMCQRLDDGRVGARIRGFRHPVRDDVMDHAPHGQLNLHTALVVSCNAYFGQLAVHLGRQAIVDAAAPTGITVASEPVSEHLRATLPYAGYGQGEVLATPLRMARVAGAIASDGVIRETSVARVTAARGAGTQPSQGVRWLTPEQASFLATSMRDAVEQGTGRALAGHRVAIAGKTGTAEVNGAPSHSWFVGFAPYATRGRRIAFAVIVENAGYGGRVAAPLAGDVVAAAQAAGVIR